MVANTLRFAVAVLLLLLPPLAFFGCSKADDGWSYHSTSYAWTYGEGDSRRVHVFRMDADGPSSNARAGLLLAVVVDYSDLVNGGYHWGGAFRIGGGMGHPKIEWDASIEAINDSDSSRLTFPCPIAASSWDSVSLNGRSFDLTQGRVILWKLFANGTSTMEGPFPFAESHSDGDGAIAEALQKAKPEYAPRK